MEPVVADGAGGFAECARRLALLAPPIPRHLVEICLELADLIGQLVFLLHDVFHAFSGALPAAAQTLYGVGHAVLLFDESFGAAQSVLHITFETLRAPAVEHAPRLL